MIEIASIIRLPFLLLIVFLFVSCDQSNQVDHPVPDIPSGRILWAEVDVPERGSLNGYASNGAQIYQERCVTCHGRRGLGDGTAAAYMITKPRNFSTGEYKLHSTADFPSGEDLYRTVTAGIPAFGMPSYEYLSPQDRWAVVDYIQGLGQSEYAARLESDAVKEELGLNLARLDSESRVQHWEELIKIHKETAGYAEEQFQAGVALQIPPTRPRTEKSLKRGKKLYLNYGCAVCHGYTGGGYDSSAEAMTDNQGRVIRPRDFREGAWYFKAGNRREDIMRVIVGGMPGTPMPSLDLGEEENGKLWDLAYYVEYLAGLKEEK